jgi:hypothetical protein
LRFSASAGSSASEASLSTGALRLTACMPTARQRALPS